MEELNLDVIIMQMDDKQIEKFENQQKFHLAMNVYCCGTMGKNIQPAKIGKTITTPSSSILIGYQYLITL